jgi:hypothetical protein
MEVHAHSHTPRKKWTHYIWEFFMLFLAVFCGMLAEYKLEHIIEHQREKQYIRSLIKDVELDLASLKSSYNNRKIQINYFDSLRSLLKDGYENHLNDLYFYARHIARPVPFQYHDRTIQQLKNSGNLRLIKNIDAADSITIYDNEIIKTTLVQQEGEVEIRRFIGNNIMGEIFDSNTWNDMTDSAGTIIRPVNNPVLLNRDRILLNKFSFIIVRLKGTLIQTNRLIISTEKSAENLIELLKKEYHLN